MPRSRSRSPHSKRDRRRSRSRSRDRRYRKKRSRSRSPRHRATPPRHRSRSVSPRRRSLSPRKRSKERELAKDKKNQIEVIEIDDSKLEGLDDEQVDMMKLMGFATFDTTKGKKVAGNDVSSVNLQRKRRYRQYMNRRGGFNRPLDFVA